MSLKEIKFSSNFTVLPADTNYIYPMVFGGKMLSEMDINAAMCVRWALEETECDSAVTVGVNRVNFFAGAKVGDLVVFESNIAGVGHKSIKVAVIGYHQLTSKNRVKICEGEFTFCARKDAVPHPHGLIL